MLEHGRAWRLCGSEDDLNLEPHALECPPCREGPESDVTPRTPYDEGIPCYLDTGGKTAKPLAILQKYFDSSSHPFVDLFIHSFIQEFL